MSATLDMGVINLESVWNKTKEISIHTAQNLSRIDA